MALVNTPADVVARLAERTAPRTRMILIVEGDIATETQLGYGWADALEALWTGEKVHPLRVFDVDTRAPAIADVTAAMAVHLEQRAIEERRTPEHLAPLLAAFGLVGFVEGARRRGPALFARAERRHV